MKLILSDRPLNLELPENGEIRHVDLSTLQIANCVGCFGCWTKTPGRCVIRDDAVRVYPLIAESDTVVYVSRIKYGGYDTIMKRMLERAIPIQQAFIRIHRGETHHLQRAVTPKHATIIAYGAIEQEERSIFERLVARNGYNMNFIDHRILYVAESEVEKNVKDLIETWKKS